MPEPLRIDTILTNCTFQSPFHIETDSGYFADMLYKITLSLCEECLPPSNSPELSPATLPQQIHDTICFLNLIPKSAQNKSAYFVHPSLKVYA